MARYNIFDGGTASNKVTNQMLPSEATAVCTPPYGYADHQRERSYGVTRRLDLRAVKSSGGGGKSQSLLCFLADTPLVVGDVLNTHLLLPNTVLQAVSLGVLSPLAGFTFSVSVVPVAVNPVVPVFANIDTTTITANSTGCKLALYQPVSDAAAYAVPSSGLLITEQAHLAITILSLPVGGLAPRCGPNGLDMWLTAHVLDLDHGNA